MASLLKTTFSNAFHCMKIVVCVHSHFIEICSQGRIENTPVLIQIRAWRRTDKSLPKPMMAQLTEAHIHPPTTVLYVTLTI